MITLGPWQLQTVSGGKFMLDGGAMFGVVPKPLWQKVAAADEQNRIEMQTNCLLARNGKQVVLIDTGYGGKLTEKERLLFNAQEGEPLVENLAAVGVAPDEVTQVVFSHLHFDHAGGGVQRRGGKLVPTFPHAQYFVQRTEWNAAVSQAAELRGSYPLENLAPLEEAGCLTLLDGHVEIVPGLRSRVTGGHTAGHHALMFQAGSEAAIYLGDICPTSAHLRALWCMAYDLFPLETRRIKPQILGQAADAGWLVFFDHDPVHAVCRLQRDEKREFTLAAIS